MFEKQTIEIPCSKCGHKTSKTAAWIKTHREFPCGGCGTIIHIEPSNFLAGIKSAEKAVDDFRRSLRRFGKR